MTENDAETVDLAHSRASRFKGLLFDPRVRAAMIVVLFAIVVSAISHQIEVTSWHEVRAALASTQAWQIVIAGLATLVSYTALVGYDVLALRHVGAQAVPFRIVALTSFISQAFTFNLGFGILTGTAVRMRLYGQTGLKSDQILATSVFATFSIWLGLLFACGVALVAAPDVAQPLMAIPEGAVRAFGLVLLAVLGWIWWYLATRRPLLPGIEVRAPTAPITGLAILVGAIDVGASGFALWTLLPAEVGLSFSSFLVIFASAIAIGIVSHVPGGLGVFESIILLSMPTAPSSSVLASLLLFRVIYYLVPMLIAAVLMALLELAQRRDVITRRAIGIRAAIGPSIPTVSAILTFVGGFILMVSGALPAEHHRMAVLRYAVPLPFVEASHFVASVIGTLLLVVAYGLARRLESAWRAAVALLLAAGVFSLVKGIDYEEAAVCFTVVLLLLAGRRWFYRQGGAFSGPLDGSEIVALGVAIITSVWIGFIAFRNVTYDSSLWWEFAYHGDAPRFLRASIGVAIAVLAALAYRFLHRSRPPSVPPSADDLSKAAAIVAQSERTQSMLALLGDKQFLFNKDGSGFVMYGTQGDSWIAMGDPIVSRDEDTAGLIWQFKELVDLNSGVPAFYEISSLNLPVFLDAGFSMVKLGEEALVDLERFSLDGPEHKKLRYAVSKFERIGASFEVVAARDVAQLLPELRGVSDRWLAEMDKREKGFSLGYWTDDYMLRHDAAVVRVNGNVVAFANLWRSANLNEASIDIMRVTPDAPNGAMDYLFTSLILHFKGEGFRWFNLGMAPLSGLSTHRLAPLWSRVAGWVSRHGDRFYKFEGLRAYKSKFKPEWRSRYLAYPGGVSLPQILVDVAALVATSPERAQIKRTPR